MGVCFNKKKNETILKKHNSKDKEKEVFSKNKSPFKGEEAKSFKNIRNEDNFKESEKLINFEKERIENSEFTVINEVHKNSNIVTENKSESVIDRNKAEEKVYRKLEPNLILENREQELKEKYNSNNDTLEKLINLNLEELVNEEEEEGKGDKIYSLNFKKNEPLFNLVDFYVTTNSEYSTDNEWTQVLKKAKFQNKSLLSLKILSIKERKWNKENILLSDIIKENRDNMDSNIITKYLNMRLKLQEHFNWLIWAVSHYYYTLLFTEATAKRVFQGDEFGLPAVESIEWINGFEWNGIFIRVQTYEQSNFLIQEVKALNYLFFEYIQLIDSYKFKDDDDYKQNYLSNELIFPLISYSNICNLILVGSVCINKYNYDINDHDKISMNLNRPTEKEAHLNNYTFNQNLFTNLNTINENPFVRYQPKANNLTTKDNIITNNNNNFTYGNEVRKTFSPKNNTYQGNCIIDSKSFITNVNILQTGQQFKTHSKYNYHTVTGNSNLSKQELIKDRKNNLSDLNSDISYIINENESCHSMRESRNVNKDFNLNLYCTEDIKESLLLSKIESKHLIKVVDDLNDYNNINTNIGTFNNYATEVNFGQINIHPKFKFMIISASQLIPDLFDNQKKHSFIYIEEDDQKRIINFSSKNFNTKFKSEIQIEKIANKNQIMVENLILTENLKEVFNYEGNFKNINYKIFYNSYNMTEELFNIAQNIRMSSDNSMINKRVNEYFLKIHSKQVSSMIYNNIKFLKNFSFGKNQNLNQLIRNNLEIKGKSVLMYSLVNPIKIKFSLIKSNKYVEMYNENFTNNIDYLNLIDKFAKNLDANLAIDNAKSLKNYFHRFGVNTSLEIFLLPKLKNSKIADLIKINILCKMIKEFFNFHEGVNFLLKINLVNANNCLDTQKSAAENLNIINDGYFNFIKEKSIMNIQKIKIYHIIMSILQAKKSNQEFINYFYDNLNFIFFNKLLKWKLTDEVIGFNLLNRDCNSITNSYSQENLLKEFLNISRKRPFIFLNILEHHLKIKIDPIIKFKASLALEQFCFYFNETFIHDSEPNVESYIKSSELSYYLFTKCIYTSKTSMKYDTFKNKFSKKSNQNSPYNIHLDKKITFRSPNANVNLNINNNCILSSKDTKETKLTQSMSNTLNQAKIFKEKSKLFYPPNSLKTKVNLLAHENNDSINLINNKKTNRPDSSGMMMMMNNNMKINSNNITKINQNNKFKDSKELEISNISQIIQKSEADDSKYISMELKTEMVIKLSEDENQLLIQKIKIWDNLSMEIDLNLPALMYKMHFKLDEKPQKKKKIYKSLRPNYSFNKIDTIKEWRSSMETLLNDVTTVDGSESIMVKSYIFLFIYAYYIENDNNRCKELIYKIKEQLRLLVYYKFDLLIIINLLEGLLIEKKNYIESEEYFSKCLIFALLSFGDPRGRGSFGKELMLFPLWKIARQTCILENSLTNESFKELFHCQDNIFKMQLNLNSSFSHNNNEHSNIVNYLNNLYVENFNYSNYPSLKTNKHKYILKYDKQASERKPKVSLSDIVFDEDINEGVSVDADNRNYFISDRNFEFINKYKYFQFPSISDTKTSYQTFFNSENFLQFFLKVMLSISESDIFYDEDNLDKLGLNCYSIAPTSEITKFNSSTIKDGFKSTPKKDKAAIFSPFLYDYLMHKISYKNNPPNSIVLSWGNNNHNETSHNNYDYLSLPRLCYKLKDEEVCKISCGWEHNIVITNNKKCFSWGNNQSGQCGIVDAPLVYNPSLIEQLDNVIEVSCGNEHSLALNNLGEVFSWGKSEDGVLGYIENNIEYIPKKIKSLEDVVSIVSGSIHNMVLMKDGTVKSWGCSKGGQLGHSEDYLMSIDNFTGYLSNPTDIESLKLAKIKKVSCGEAHSLALTTDGKVYGWGFTSNGQLGLGFCEDSFEPGQGMTKCRILEPRLIKTDYNYIIDIQCGKTFSSFIDEKNEVLVCGVNDLNQLGIDQPMSIDHIFRKEDAYLSRCYDIVFPTPIECFLNMKVHKVACGESHCLALITDLSNTVLSLWSWGSNRFGQLGQGNQIKKSNPKPINYVLGFTNTEVAEIACGAYHSLCLLSNRYIDIKNDKNDEKLLYSYSFKWAMK